MSRTVVVTSYRPALGSGRATRTSGIVRALAALQRVDVLYVPFGDPRPNPYADLADVRLHEHPAARGARRARTYASALAAGVPAPVARGVAPGLGSAAARLAGENARIVADDPMAAVALWPLAARRPVIYSAHNLESAFRADLDSGWGSRARLERFERRLLTRAAESWMPSRPDLEGARRLAPGARLRYAPNVVDVSAIPVTRPRSDEHEMLFVADLTYEPNRQALRFLLDEVVPIVWRTVPDARLSVVGRGLDASSHADARIRFHGFVEDLGARYRAAACAVVPLLTGGGSPLKFIEALAYGVPVVGTPRAAAGLEVAAGEHYLEGDGAEGFATAVIDAFDAERGRRVGAGGRALAAREYSVESLTRRLVEVAA